MTRQVERAYLDELSRMLRMRGLEPDKIGEILAEVEAHVSATGEPARAAFGSPAQYARMWSPGVDQSGSTRRAVFVLMAAILGVVLVDLVLKIIHGEAAGFLGTTARWGAVLAILAISPVASARGLVDPLTGRHPSGFAREWLVGVVCGVLGAASLVGTGMLLLGAFLLGAGDPAIGLNRGVGHWWLLGIGLPLVAAGLTVLPVFYVPHVINPRSGRPAGRSRPRYRLTGGCVIVVATLAFLGLGLILR